MTSNTTEMTFVSSDGVRLHGTQVVPSGARALVVFVHGITSDRSEWGVFDKAAEILAKHGVASLRFDYRGHGESAFPSTEITLEGIRLDIEAAWNALMPQNAPGSQHFIVGSSFGGGLAYNVASTIGGFDRAFLLAPVFDYARDIKKTASDWQADIEQKGYIEYSVLKLAPAIIPEAEAFHAIPVHSDLPATIFHGTKDDDVPITSSRSVVLDNPGFELVEVEGAGHVIAEPGDFDMEAEQSWNFVNYVLGEIVARMRLDG